MNEKDREALAILQEEAAEVIQAASKMLRFGPDSHWNGRTTQQDLETEIGDLQALIGILYERGIIREQQVQEAEICKIQKLHTWSTLFQEEE